MKDLLMIFVVVMVIFYFLASPANKTRVRHNLSDTWDALTERFEHRVYEGLPK